MNFTISRENLLKALMRVNGIVDAKGTMPILSNLLLETIDPDFINISATDLDISFKGEYKAEISSTGATTVNGKKIFDIVKELQGDKVEIISDENNWVTIKCNDSTFNIPGLPAEEFPNIPVYDGDNKFQIGILAFKDMVKKILLCISNDKSRLALTGALLEIEDGTIRMASTDGHRLAYVEEREAVNSLTTEKISIIIPKKPLLEILKIDDTEGNIQISIFNNYVVFQKDTNVLISRIIDEQYPDYTEVIPENFSKRVKVDKDQLVGALRRVSIMADEESKMIKFCVQNNSIKLISDSIDLGGAIENLPAIYDGEEMIIGLNASYMLDVLNLFNGEIYVDLINPKSAAHIGCTSIGSFKYIIMPMRIRELGAEDDDY